ncbi:glycosyltransferase family A protein [Cohnella sp. GCM10027633]|uniref:glycosyltransferase family A protein n=1 Tax=unclassified Cohnella TaxID=2636738 RepID=UPI00363D8585
MIPELLWIIGCYAAAALVAHWVYKRSVAGGIRRHYVLVAGNHESEIEGCVRALQRYSRRTGTDVGITVVLDGSSDETGAIVERFTRDGSGIGWIRWEDEEAKLKLHRWERSREVAAAGSEQGLGQELGQELGQYGGQGQEHAIGQGQEQEHGAGQEHEKEQVVWIDLGVREHVTRLPMWRRW